MVKVALCKDLALEGCDVVPLIALHIGEQLDADLLATGAGGAKQSTCATVRKRCRIRDRYDAFPSSENKCSSASLGSGRWGGGSWDFAVRVGFFFVTHADYSYLTDRNAITLRKGDRTPDPSAVQQGTISAAQVG